ncbi:malate dehydrogenase, cytoplasmic-like [Corticium candelabrum]|uniref:malate dehydrogenase, cytoplasmic-like n=1 Tax=Corticium candelabrum TaxID=121492 RepID=UPI002E2631BD|nr:malate dehydrogenase, cytoplasmic-like [Corticium candelabrum]
MSEHLRVCITGAAGQIAYSLLHPIANGDVFGKDRPLTLLLLDIPQMMEVLKGVVMEMMDCSLPLLKDVIATADPNVAFKGIDVAILVGAMPRREGMQRKDLLKANAGIFTAQGKALDAHAKKSVKVLVVGNPANTNCMIAMLNAPSIPRKNFTALTRLDQNRAQAQVAARLKARCDLVHNVIIWGNHSGTQYVDPTHAHVITDQGKQDVCSAIKDDAWIQGEFLVTVQKRGAAVIAARKLSSAMSAAKAICDHMRDWFYGTKPP